MASRNRAVFRIGFAALGAAFSVFGATAIAQAAAPPVIHLGLYGAKATLVAAHKTAAVNVIVVNHSTQAKDVGIACNSGTNPAQGIMPDTTLTIHIPGLLKISAAGTFSYAGVVKLTTSDTQSGVTATSHVSIHGHFIAGKIVLNKTIALKGTVTSTLCSATSPKTFSLVWASSSTAA